jgi:competence protein ComEC
MKNNSKKFLGILILIIAICLCGIYLFSNKNTNVGQLPNNFAIADESNLQIIYFNVGDADCILVKDDKDIMLIDSGNDEDGKYIVEYLKKLGITKINYLIGTHEHEDHIGGMDSIIKNFTIDNIYIPKIKNESATQYKQVLETANSKGYKVTNITNTNHNWYIGDSFCKIEYVGIEESNPNNNSIVILLTESNNKYLFTGDIERKVENILEGNKEIQSINVFKVPHHGSDTSSSDTFVNIVNPKISIVSAGNNETILDEKIIENLKKYGEVYITRNDGSILTTSENGIITVDKLNTKVDSTQH